ncbi:MAG: hypothetical protein GXY13_11585 [Acidimicrobiales bacterium]|nr:hypothetical protein [Acidimicrobiales bacterium]
MTTAPAPYPRIAHLAGGRGTSDDKVLSETDRARLLGSPVAIEEKLDGANVVLWLDDHVVRCALRSGPGGADRAGQLGPLRAWIAENNGALVGVLGDEPLGLYAEWLLLTHTVAYDRLPSYLVVLDLRHGDGSFVSVDERNERCERFGLASPPELWRGVPGSIEAVEARLGRSQVGSHDAEGLVVRSLRADADPRLAKVWRPGFSPLPDSEWSRGRPRNQLADAEASWH